MSRKKPSEALDEKDLHKLLGMPDRHSELGKRDYAILLWLYATGARSFELANLKRGDIQQSGEGTKVRIFGKGGKWRTLPIEDENLFHALKTYWKKINYNPAAEDPLFLTIRKEGYMGANGIDTQAVGLCVKRYAQAGDFGTPPTPHSLRHTCLTDMLARKIDIKTVSAFAGHSNVSTTSRYVHTTEERLRKAAKAIVLRSR